MLSSEIAEYLDALGIGRFDESGATGDIFITAVPPQPDEATIITQTGGLSARGYDHYDNPSVQVRVRGTRDPRVAEARAQAIYDALHGMRNTRLVDGGAFVVSCLAVSAPASIGQDENRRHEYTINFRLQVANDARRI
jgi:hypothetical protein